MRILYVEDEKFLADAVKFNLEKNGMKVDLASDGEEGLDMATSDIYDCVVLDIMLPKLSGTDILRRMREKKIDTPVIMLSALSEVEDKVRELDNGADDYLAKPFKTKELVARIHALMRRPTVIKNKKIVYEDIEFDENTKELNGSQLTAKEAALLVELLRVPGKLVSKEYLLSKIWGEDGIGEDNYVETYVSRVRKVLKGVKSKVKIKTVRGLGYRLS